MFLQIHWNVDPTIFRLGPLAPRWYGLLFASGFLVGFYLMRNVFQRENRPETDLDFLLLYLLGGTVIGARLGHVLFYAPSYYLMNPSEIIAIWKGGLASHGGLLGVPLAICNLFNSEILGVPTDLPWGVVFERAAQLRPGVEAVPLHPVQVYESISYLLIFVGLWALYRRWGEDTPRGLLIGLFFVLVFGVRIVLEVFKREQAHFALDLPLGMSMGQLLSVPAVALGLWLIWRAVAAEPSTAHS
ncbi:MAG: prolipoprotein diacylglyceryl transferase [Bacteroidetes bacterium QH_2_63_10]|nr:MAG: prolipoprotein diacylglyceryl transferase [Bacteroidetes bacterium QH_2_63_10]